MATVPSAPGHVLTSRARTLKAPGSNLIKSDVVALRELVTNPSDADTTRFLSEIDCSHKPIDVIDNRCVTRAVIEQLKNLSR